MQTEVSYTAIQRAIHNQGRDPWYFNLFEDENFENKRHVAGEGNLPCGYGNLGGPVEGLQAMFYIVN